MAPKIEFVKGGGITSPKGFSAGATFAGMKTYAEDKLDLGLFLSESPCAVAGLFTTNRVKSPSVLLTEELLAGGELRAVVANSGIANTSVGDQGMKDARETVELAAKHLGLRPEEVAICSTGVIGIELPMALIRESIGKIELSEDGGNTFARAIMTTDTRPKEVAVTFEVGRRKTTIGGCIKGAGMIHPNMATMLCFLTTDAAVEWGFLQDALKEAIDASLNMVSIDGDTSTNDTVLLYANGAAGNDLIRAGTSEAETFQQALNAVCTYLAKETARDGEGASRILKIQVDGAKSVEDARKAARTIVSSNLVKTAVHGSDPNWGRIIAALGRSGAELDEGRINLYVNDVCIVWEGRSISFHKDAVVAIMRGPEVAFRLDLNLGDGSATAWGCALSEEYVTINSAYST